MHVFGYHGDGRYRFTLAGYHRGPVRTSTGVVLQAEAGLRALTTADTVIMPGYEEVLRPTPAPVLAGLRAAAGRERGCCRSAPGPSRSPMPACSTAAAPPPTGPWRPNSLNASRP